MNDSDQSQLHHIHLSHATETPAGATICTVYKALNEVWINCAGFRRQFRNLHHAADFLDMGEWRDLEAMFIAEGSPLILIRHDGKWQSSARI
jgi:hypothetical protein